MSEIQMEENSDARDPLQEFLDEEQRQLAEIDDQIPIQNDSDQIRQWKIAFEQRLVEKDEKEHDLMEVMKSEAKTILNEWTRKIQEDLDNKKKRFKDQSIDNDSFVESDSSWDGILNLCEMGRSTHKDRSRMKAVFLSLKQQQMPDNDLKQALNGPSE